MPNSLQPLLYEDEKEPRKIIKVEIVDAKYVKEERTLLVKVALPNGVEKTCGIPTSNTYKKQKISDEEAHRQMEITAEMYRKSSGRHVFMDAEQEQIVGY
jgi:hypothetical protein